MGKEDSLREEIIPSSYGDRITVLSIDGGGIRGIIPGTILSFLESKLQVCIANIYNLTLIIYIHVWYLVLSVSAWTNRSLWLHLRFLNFV